MDYIPCPIILYSQDKIRMMDFLSDVFEFEVNSVEDVIHNGAFNLRLIELPVGEKENFQSSGVRFAFKLKDPKEMSEIINKYNFFLYRKSPLLKKEEICIIEATQLLIKDIDGRIWQFDVEPLQ
jgi:hypothetical protein